MSLLIYPKFSAQNVSGLNLSGGLVYFYEVGTSTPKDTYTDSGLGTTNSNPVVLNSRGEADIYLVGRYKIILKDVDDVEIWTEPDFSGTLLNTAGIEDNATSTQLTISDTEVTFNKIVNDQEGNIRTGRKNLLIGNFFINQDGVSGTVVLGAGVYGHDGFRGGSGGCTYTFATVNGITTVTISAGTLEQEIEAVEIGAGDYILSWVGTAQGQIDGGGFGDSGLVTGTLNGSANVTVEFDTGTLSLPQLELGTNVTAFDRRFIWEELALCQRHYYISKVLSQAVGGSFSGSTAGAAGGFILPVSMRATPIMVINSLRLSLGSGTSFNITGGSVTGFNQNIVSVTFTSVGTATGNSYYLRAQSAVTGSISFDARL